MKKDSVKQFTRFLKDDGSYKAFINNFKSYEGTKTRLRWAKGEIESGCWTFKNIPDRTFKSYCKELSQTTDVLNYAFAWAETLEGFNFWQGVASRWKEKLKD